MKVTVGVLVVGLFTALNTASAANYSCVISVTQVVSSHGTFGPPMTHAIRVPGPVDFSRFSAQSSQGSAAEVRALLRDPSLMSRSVQEVVHRARAVTGVCGVEGPANVNVIVRKVFDPVDGQSPAALGLRVDIYDNDSSTTGNGTRRAHLEVSTSALSFLDPNPPSVLHARTTLLRSSSAVGCNTGTLEIRCSRVAGR